MTAAPLDRPAIQALTPEGLAALVPVISLDEARKVVAMVHRDEPIRATSAVRRVAAEAVRAVVHRPTLEVEAEAASTVDPFVKYRACTDDGQRLECVRIPLENPGRFTACVSSQAGCALGCAFCATGRLGLRRNLEAWEIVEQVAIVRRRLQTGRVHGVVFQGMGEPMANLDNVLAAIRVLSNPCAFGIDARAITVSTVGLPHGILRLAREAPRVRLGVSLGSLVPGARRSLMPIDGAHPIDDVLAAVATHARLTGHAPMWAYALLAGVNDDVVAAQALADRALAFWRDTGLRPRLSLIPYNPIGADDPFARSDDATEGRFRDVLSAAGLAHHKRYSGGGDVAAACGQLAAAGPGLGRGLRS